ncbi:MobA/MobL family protein [Macrococcus armenti]|uniref:MobA/MobL family protein n=1 Tax=Macrococcus armenti TaxID=2875764 RepID=UPI001CCB6060|nr:MobA/MobL family protein [Macrococcus armenti]UBH09790.1 MobA/MobL family protein [Macrococcus armenti]
MAIYHFQNKIVSRANNQSVIAKSAYNSATKIKDYQENEVKDYSNKQCDYSNILLPKNAPETYKDREFLWNKVSDTEKRKDSQLAREIIIGLPNEFDREQNIELALEFAESLSEEGMIVDLNIHKIDFENPHAHLLCTLRGLKENGEFEPKRNGNKFIRDWNTKDKNIEWRKRWENIQNKHLEKHGFLSRVSSESYDKQNVDLQPTKKEGWKARKFEDETGKKSKISLHNEKIKAENNKKINNEYKSNYDKQTKKNNSFAYLENKDEQEIKKLAKELKLFITPTNIFKEQNKIADLKSKLALINDEDTKLEKLNKFDDRSEKLEYLNSIFEKQANTFFNENYKEIADNYTADEKVYITYAVLNDYNDLPGKEELDDILEPKNKIEAQIALNTLLNKREISLESLNKESDFFTKKLDEFLTQNDINIDDVLNNNVNDSKVYDKAMYYIDKLDSLRKGEELLDNYYNSNIKELFDNEDEYTAFIESTTLKEKQNFIDFKDFHGEENTIKMIQQDKFIPRFTKEERQEISKIIVELQEKKFKKNKTQFEHYAITQLTKKCLDVYNIDPANDNDIKHLYQESEYENDNVSSKYIKEYFESENIFNNHNNSYKSYNTNSMLSSSIDVMIFNFGEIFRERMPKYINKQYKSKNYSKERHELKNKRGIHL